MTTPKKPKKPATPKPKHPFPLTVYSPGHEGSIQMKADGVGIGLSDTLEEAAEYEEYQLVARYVLDKVYRVNRGATFEEIK